MLTSAVDCWLQDGRGRVEGQSGRVGAKAGQYGEHGGGAKRRECSCRPQTTAQGVTEAALQARVDQAEIELVNTVSMNVTPNSQSADSRLRTRSTTPPSRR
jgi:hypothetical protein